MRTKLFLSAIAACTAIAANAYAADVVTSGDLATMDKWYGNAGGLQGSDRVTYLNASRAKVGVGYDKDVAERTNMQRHEVPSTTAGIAYDKDVAERTNLPRSQKSTPIQEAGVSNK